MLYINDKVRISKIDERNLMVEYHKNVKDKVTKQIKQEWVFEGYYYSLENALVGVMKKYSRDVVNVADDIHTAIKTLNDMYTEIKTIAKDIQI